VDTPSAVRLLERAIPRAGGTWADLGCGDGTFTLALADLLGPDARIYALDRDPGALSRLRRRTRARTNVISVEGDFTDSLDLPGERGALDGILFANSLHYVPEPEDVLGRWATRLRSEGRAVFVEYDRRTANRWVPYPIPPRRLAEIAASTGLSEPVITATRPSSYSGTLYAAYSVRHDVQRTGTIT
jgi:ubiquinone/menaquinone biosynthesis C-methylase UbiE